VRNAQIKNLKDCIVKLRVTCDSQIKNLEERLLAQVEETNNLKAQLELETLWGNGTLDIYDPFSC
jgi:predicted  nucleic acid-binding Zn-ribbon protein